MNDVGNEVDGKVEVGDGLGKLLDALLADTIDSGDKDTCSTLRVCTDDFDEVRRGFFGLGEEEMIKSFACG